MERALWTGLCSESRMTAPLEVLADAQLRTPPNSDSELARRSWRSAVTMTPPKCDSPPPKDREEVLRSVWGTPSGTPGAPERAAQKRRRRSQLRSARNSPPWSDSESRGTPRRRGTEAHDENDTAEVRRNLDFTRLSQAFDQPEPEPENEIEHEQQPPITPRRLIFADNDDEVMDVGTAPTTVVRPRPLPAGTPVRRRRQITASPATAMDGTPAPIPRRLSRNIQVDSEVQTTPRNVACTLPR